MPPGRPLDHMQLDKEACLINSKNGDFLYLIMYMYVKLTKPFNNEPKNAFSLWKIVA